MRDKRIFKSNRILLLKTFGLKWFSTYDICFTCYQYIFRLFEYLLKSLFPQRITEIILEESCKKMRHYMQTFEVGRRRLKKEERRRPKTPKKTKQTPNNFLFCFV